MSAITRKIKVGLAAGAMATAATLAPVTVAPAAQAAPASGVAGQSLIQPACVPGPGVICPAAVVQAAPNNIFQNQIWWIGGANPTPPPRSDILVFTPLSLVPGFLKPAYGWFTQNLNFEVCLLGGSIKVGPYGTTTVSVGRGCN